MGYGVKWLQKRETVGGCRVRDSLIWRPEDADQKCSVQGHIQVWEWTGVLQSQTTDPHIPPSPVLAFCLSLIIKMSQASSRYIELSTG